ncbi:hypothetical protein BH11PLA2_BH11PLA2_02750 [soil metagenome]
MHKFVILIGMTMLAGCSSTPPMVSVKGVVKRNGQPVEHCQVCFYPDRDDANPLEHGYGITVTGPDGSYEIKNALGDTGIFPGTYRVVLVLYHENRTGKTMPMNMKPSEVPGGVKNVMPVEYSDPRTSPETIVVPRGGLVKNFDISAP